MAKIPEQAWIAVCVTMPPDMDGHQTAEEVRKAIGFGQPVALLMGTLRPEPPDPDEPDAEVRVTWQPEDWSGLLREDVLWTDAGNERDISRESPAPDLPGV